VQHLIDTPLELANCDRCKAYVFKCDVSGLRTVVDCAPLDGMDDVRRRLMMGRAVYRTLPGRKLALFAPLSTNRDSGYLGEHWGGPGVVGAKGVDTVAVGPHRAPVTPGGPKGGFHHPHAPADGSQGRTATFDHARTQTPSSSNPPSRATHAKNRRSERLPYINRVCEICRVMIGRTHNVIGVQIGDRWAWVQHDECPPPEKAET